MWAAKVTVVKPICLSKVFLRIWCRVA